MYHGFPVSCSIYRELGSTILSLQQVRSWQPKKSTTLSRSIQEGRSQGKLQPLKLEKRQVKRGCHGLQEQTRQWKAMWEPVPDTSCLATQKNYKAFQKATPPPQFEDREQALEPDMADMAGILELSHQQLKKSIINMLRALIKKVAGMQEQIGNVSREMEIPRKNQNKC